MKRINVIFAVIIIIIIFEVLPIAVIHKGGIWAIIGDGLKNEYEESTEEYVKVKWQDGLFNIKHFMSKDCLQLNYSDYDVVLMNDVLNYKITKEKMYVVGNNDYAVVDKNNESLIFIGSYSGLDYQVPEYEIKRDGRTIIFSKEYKDSHIIYLTAFEDFPETDQKYLAKIK